MENPATRKRKTLGLTRTFSSENVLLESPPSTKPVVVLSPSVAIPDFPDYFRGDFDQENENSASLRGDESPPGQCVPELKTPLKRRFSSHFGEEEGGGEGEGPRVKRRLFEGEEEEEAEGEGGFPPPKQKPAPKAGSPLQPRPLKLKGILSNSRSRLPALKYPPSGGSLRASASPQTVPVFKVPYPKRAQPRLLHLSPLSTTFVKRQEGSRAPEEGKQKESEEDAGDTPSEEAQVVPPNHLPVLPEPAEEPEAVPQQPIPPPSPRKKIRPSFISPRRTLAPPGAPKQIQPTTAPQKLFAVTVKLTAKKAAKWMDAVVVSRGSSLFLVHESLDRIISLRKQNSKSPFVVRQDRIEEFALRDAPFLGTAAAEKSEEFVLGKWSLMLTEEVLMADFVFKQGAISFKDLPPQPLTPTHIGFKMLQKLGWQGGSLGKDGQGRTEPIPVVQKTNKQGIGFSPGE